MNRILKATSLTNLNKNVLYQFTRMSSQYLINDPKYAFLKELGLKEKNYGVFSKHGRWFGDGEVTFLNKTSFSNYIPFKKLIFPFFKDS